MFVHVGKIISKTTDNTAHEHRGVIQARGALEELFQEMAMPQPLANACAISYSEKQRGVVFTTPNKSIASNISLELARLVELLKKHGLTVETITVR